MAKQKQDRADISLVEHYDHMVAVGKVTDDMAQRGVLRALEGVLHTLSTSSRHRPGSRFLRAWLPAYAGMTALQGLYIWGNVGRGKSMLMELFFANAPESRKRRVHFQAFMQEVHKRIHGLRAQAGYTGDPVAALAKEIATETRLLCFDELQATDPADASLLQRLFSGLFEHGVCVVSTSNHPPKSLYTGGVQKERFAKFIALLEANMQVVALDSHADYRRRQIKSLEKLYFYPLGKDADDFVVQVIDTIADGVSPTDGKIDIQGRTIHFALYNETVGRFSFKELCSANLGSADYLAIASQLETVILTDIPALSPEQRNEARRFINLIDALYEAKVKLICTAASTADTLYHDGDGSFEFQRTASRLAEMQSEKYLHDEKKL